MRKVKFLLISLMTLTFSSCGKVEPTPVPSGSTIEPTIDPTVDSTSEPTSEPLPEKNILYAPKQNMNIESIEEIPGIATILNILEMDEQSGLYIPTGSTKIFSLFYVEPIRYEWNVELEDNSYYAYCGSSDFNNEELTGEVYSYIYCNKQVELFDKEIIVKDSKGNEYTIYYQQTQFEYGYLLEVQYKFITEENEYVIGCKHLNRHIDLSNYGIEYVNNNSNYELKVGYDYNDIKNHPSYEEFSYKNDAGMMNYIKDFVNYSLADIPLGSQIKDANSSIRNASYLYGPVVTGLCCYGENFDVCGVKYGMMLNEAIDLLKSQGFEFVEENIYRMGYMRIDIMTANDVVTKVFVGVNFGVIVLEEY